MLYVDNGRKNLYFHKDTGKFDWCSCSESEMQHMDPNQLLSMSEEDTNNFRFLIFDEIDHEGLMRFYVHECVEDKAIRKVLFGILRSRDFVRLFVDKLHELGLCDEYVFFNGDVYDQ